MNRSYSNDVQFSLADVNLRLLSDKVSGNVGLKLSEESLEIPGKAACVHVSIPAQWRLLVSNQRYAIKTDYMN